MATDVFDILKQVWPEWKIVNRIGGGAYGTVYEAVRRDYDVESRAAIKIISVPKNQSEIDTLRTEGMTPEASKTYLHCLVNNFVNEIRLMISLEGSPNIVDVKDYRVVEKTDELGWNIFIRMELLTPFYVYTCDKKLSESDVIKLGCDICTALETCAEQNIIHRDIKPGNILVNKKGDFKLGDFGIARKLENMTGGLSQKYTPKYMAPEVAISPNYDSRVDIYSIGIVLYEQLNKGRIPFQVEKQISTPSDIENAIRRRNASEPLPAPCDASPAMADLILRACAWDPNMRFASATEMKQALMSVADGTYLDKTWTARKAPAAFDQGCTPAVNTFDAPCRKRRNFFKSDSSILKKRNDCDDCGAMPINPVPTSYPQGVLFPDSRNLDYEEDSRSMAENQNFDCSPWEIYSANKQKANTAVTELLRTSTQCNCTSHVPLIARKTISTDAKELSLSQYRLSADDIQTLSQCIHLKNLNLSAIQIVDDKAVEGLTKSIGLHLIVLDLRALSNLTDLSILDISFNYLDNIDCLSNLNNLTTLILHHNRLRNVSILNKLAGLFELNLSHNMLTDISELSGLTELTTLELSFNKITDISSLRYLHKLTKLDITSNKISDLSPLSQLHHLAELHLQFNPICDIRFLLEMKNLTYLSIGIHALDSISVICGLTHLKKLSLWCEDWAKKDIYKQKYKKKIDALQRALPKCCIEYVD